MMAIVLIAVPKELIIPRCVYKIKVGVYSHDADNSKSADNDWGGNNKAGC